MKYDLIICCYRKGLVKDGGLHATRECVDDSEALAEMKKEVPFLMSCYDKVVFIVKEGKRVVCNWTQRERKR